nr:AAA family ATPase [Nitrospirales bacterium]
MVVGERRQATVLFSDLSGYTAMNEHLDPEEVEAIMRRIKNHAVRIVESHEGIVNQFVGDEVMALFGICAAHEDDPLRAVRTALELHAVVRAMSPEVDARIGQPLRMRTGIHTGLIVTNSRDTRDGLYGITGETVITGVRLKTEAEPNEILVSPQTHRLIAPYFETEELPAVRVKGKAELLRPYRALRPLPVRSRFEASARRGFTRYTGRQDELAVLYGCLERTIRGEGQFITVMGEAGVGKSRLLHEFISSLGREHVSVLQGTCHAHGSTTSYLPFLDTLRRELNVVEGRSREEVLDTAVATLTALGPSLKAYLPFYLHLLSIRTDPMIAHMQGPELRHAMQEALTGLIMAKAERQPTLLFLEDWHWHDEASEAVIQHLLTLMGGHSLLVGITYRSECS